MLNPFKTTKSALVSAVISAGTIGLAGCGNDNAPVSYVTESSVIGAPTVLPQRIVSLDFCADQYVLKMVDREHIAAVSPDAVMPFSYMRDSAVGVNTVRAVAESVLALKPDLVVRSFGGGPNITRFLKSAGIPVLNVGWAGDLDGVKQVTLEMAQGLGVPDRGAAIVADMEARLERLSTRAEDNVAMYMTPGGATTGQGSLVHELLVAAGLENFQDQAGWRSIPLERLAYEQPDLIAAGFFDTNGSNVNTWSAMRHPLARDQLRKRPTVYLNGAWMSCGAWFATDAIEALAERRYGQAAE